MPVEVKGNIKEPLKGMSQGWWIEEHRQYDNVEREHYIWKDLSKELLQNMGDEGKTQG